jgi:uncharacterized membrane protein
MPMRGWLFWIFATILLMVGVHLATILFIPRFEGGKRAKDAMEAGELNKLTILSTPKKVYEVLGETNPDLIYAICPFDITQKPVIVTAKVPSRYWSMAIYSDDGDNLYTLNDQQVGVEAFYAELVLEGRSGPPSGANTPREGESLTIRSPSERGIIIFRSFAGDRSERERAREQLAQTTCSTS